MNLISASNNSKIILKKMHKVCVTILIFILVNLVFLNPIKTFAATYYVDTNVTDTHVASSTPDFTTYNPTTFSTSTGSSSVYKTIADISATTLSPGDSILFKRGDTWIEKLAIPTAGTTNGWITLGAYGSGDKPIIDGTGNGYALTSSGNRGFITIENIHFTSGSGSVIDVAGGHDITIQDCEVTGGGVNGITFYGAGSDIFNLIIQRNLVHNNTESGIEIGNSTVPGPSTILISNNTVYNNGVDNGDHGIYSYRVTGLTISNNTVYGSTGAGIKIRTSVPNAQVKSNLSYSNVWGIVVGAGIGGIPAGDNPVISNNICYSNSESGIHITDTSGPIESGTFVNNTIVNNSQVGIYLYATGDTIYNLTFKNTLVYQDSSITGSRPLGLSRVAFASANTWDNNLWYLSGTSNVARIEGIFKTMTEWKAYGGSPDLHGINSDPLFINVSSNNFHLQKSSPATNVGADLSSIFTTDYSGTTRPKGIAFDIGAYEYIPLTVTINQKNDQTDPTSTSPINFTVVFSESVTDFETGDITLSGTAGATTATVTGSETTYNVAVSGMTTNGTVIASILADKATGATGNTNEASTTSDNSVTYDTSIPTPTPTPSVNSEPGSFSISNVPINNNTNKTSKEKKYSYKTEKGEEKKTYSILDGGLTNLKNIAVAWNSPKAAGSSVDSYKVYLKKVNKDYSFKKIKTLESTKKYFAFKDLDDGKYEWYVKAYDINGNSSKTKTYSFKIDTKAPKVPTIFKINTKAFNQGLWLGSVTSLMIEGSVEDNSTLYIDITNPTKTYKFQTVTCNPAGSIGGGIAKIQCTAFATIQNTKYNFDIYAKDKAGNKSEVISKLIN